MYNDKKKHLIVPNRVPRAVPKLFTKEEYERLKGNATVLTDKEKHAIIDKSLALRRQQEEESRTRKEQLAKGQLEQKQDSGSKLCAVENDAKKNTFYLLKRAFELRQEQEDEVKKANQLILASKCLAIRAAQVVEKEVIKREIHEEERRLDFMMEEERRLALEEEERRRLREKERKQRFVNEMMQQIREKEIEKLQEGERIEEEARMQNRALIQMQRDEDAKIQAKLKQQAKMRNNLLRANNEIARFKQVEKEEQRIADLRVEEYMRKKAEREKAIEEELELVKQAKEKEIARLRALQEKEQDKQAAKDEMNAYRIQEEVERASRNKERKAAERRAKNEENLRLARRKQIEDIRKQQAMELEKEKIDFMKIVEVQKHLLQKEKDKQQRRKEENEKHRQQILQQVNQKERQRIIEQKEKFEEGVAIRAEEEMRLRHINATLHSKMAKLRANLVPEVVVKDIERQLKL